MKLISCLVSGIAGAANGTVDVYSRGTLTRATQYTTFEGDGAFTPSAATALDSNGGAVVYVNEYVTCVVRDANLNVVRTFTDGDTATSTEVESASFTGTSYGSAATGPSYPVPLSTVLDRWVTSAGSIDWKVSVGGVATNLSAAFAAIAGLFFNVKSSAYGAAGNGTTDDTSAVQAALTAAAVAGGIVFFPPGTYRITTALVVAAKVSLMGCGSGASILSIDHASNTLLNYPSSTSGKWVSMRGLTLTPQQTYTAGALVAIAGATCLLIDDCYFGGPNLVSYALAPDAASSRIVCRSTQFVGGTGAAQLIKDGAGTRQFIGCRFVSGNSASIAINCTSCTSSSFIGCEFDWSAIASGSATCIYTNIPAAGSLMTVTDCQWIGPSGGTVTGIAWQGIKDGLREGNNIFPTTVTPYSGLSNSGTASSRIGNVVTSRHGRKERIASDAAVSVSHETYETTHIRRTTNADQTVTINAPLYPGQEFFLVYDNGNVGAIATVTISSCKGLASFGINASSVSVYHMKAGDTGTGTGLYWFLVGSTTNVSAP